MWRVSAACQGRRHRVWDSARTRQCRRAPAGARRGSRCLWLLLLCLRECARGVVCALACGGCMFTRLTLGACMRMLRPSCTAVPRQWPGQPWQADRGPTGLGPNKINLMRPAMHRPDEHDQQAPPPPAAESATFASAIAENWPSAPCASLWRPPRPPVCFMPSLTSCGGLGQNGTHATPQRAGIIGGFTSARARKRHRARRPTQIAPPWAHRGGLRLRQRPSQCTRGSPRGSPEPAAPGAPGWVAAYPPRPLRRRSRRL